MPQLLSYAAMACPGNQILHAKDELHPVVNNSEHLFIAINPVAFSLGPLSVHWYGIMYLLAFLLPWQTRLIIKPGELNGGYSEYSTISLYASDLIIIGLFILLCIWLWFNRKKEGSSIRIKKYWYLIGV